MNLKDKNIGCFFNAKNIYRPNADFLFTAFNNKKYHSCRSIIHFYLWDTHFKPIETKEGFAKLLGEMKQKGVRYVCQTDFSCWFHYDKQRRENIIRNFEYYDMIRQSGFDPILNFNTIFLDHFDLYKAKLQKHHAGLVYDCNHSELHFKQYEMATFAELLKISSFDNLFVLSGKIKDSLEKNYSDLFQLFRSHGAKITVIPTAMTVLKIKKKKFYS